MKLIVPVPPSVNELYSPNKGGGQRKSAKYQAWINQAERFYLRVKRETKPVYGKYTFHMKVPAHMRGDVDNRAKAALDFLKNMGLTDDDRHCVRATVERNEYLTAVAEIVVEAA